MSAATFAISPLVQVEHVWTNGRGQRCVRIICPSNCHQIDRRRRRAARDVHEWPPGDTIGLVIAHCRDAFGRSYWLAAPEGEVNP